MSDYEFINDRDGAGHTLGRKLVEAIDGDTKSFRTRIMNDGGNTVMLRTKGGMPEVTMLVPKKPPVCVLGPLTEINFKYVATDPTKTTGYRRWYGEPNPSVDGGQKTPKYHFSSDGLLCLEARKLQKICFLDANAQTVDFLFAERPDDDTLTADQLPEIDPAAAGAQGRFRFTEGKYPEREWYPPETADIGWAFHGPTINGTVGPNPVSAVKFVIHRLRSMMFKVTDAQGEVDNVKIKWIFANPTAPTRTLGDTNTCVNRNAREISFSDRHFFPTNGNMDKLSMSVGLDEPPAVVGGPSFELYFKTPGSFIAAIDPEGAIGNVRPADVTKAIDLCEFATFGNPYHGLLWRPFSSPTATLYRDSSRVDTWGFTPNEPYYGLSADGGSALTHKYYNVTGREPTAVQNQVKADGIPGGIFYPDALLYFGAWYVKDVDYAGWGQLQYSEMLYRDGKNNVWVVDVKVVSVERTYAYANLTLAELTTLGLVGVDDAKVNVEVRLMRRYGVLGIDFSGLILANDTINTVIASFSFIDKQAWVADTLAQVSLNRQYSFIPASDAKSIMCVGRLMVQYESMYPIRSACLLTVNGNGAIVADAAHNIKIGDGISVDHQDYNVNYDSTGVVGATSYRLETLDLYYANARWNVISGVTKRRNAGGGYYDYSAQIFRNGDLVCSQAVFASPDYGFAIVPVRTQPAVQDDVGQYTELKPPYWEPLAWTVIRINDSNPTTTKLVYRDAAIDVSQADFHTYVDATLAHNYSAKLGWAYDYRTHELITVPNATVAYFI